MVFPISVLSFDFSGWMVRLFTLSTNKIQIQIQIQMSCSIIGSLAGTSYWGPVAGHGLLTHDLELIRAQRKEMQSQSSGIVKRGNTEVVALTGEGDDAYVRIHSRKRKEGEEVN